MPQNKGMHLICLTNNDKEVNLRCGPETGIKHSGIGRNLCSIEVNPEGKAYLKILRKSDAYCLLQNGEKLRKIFILLFLSGIKMY